MRVSGAAGNETKLVRQLSATPSSMLASGTRWAEERLPRMHITADLSREKERVHRIQAIVVSYEKAKKPICTQLASL